MRPLPKSVTASYSLFCFAYRTEILEISLVTGFLEDGPRHLGHQVWKVVVVESATGLAVDGTVTCRELTSVDFVLGLHDVSSCLPYRSSCRLPDLFQDIQK